MTAAIDGEQNPWIDLPESAPYVLAADSVPVARFNSTARVSFRIELDLLPEPFVGRVDAPIVLLTLNPGVSADDFALHADEAFRKRVRRCYVQDVMEYPNYYLDPAVPGPGARWLQRIARPLVAQFGTRAVANGLTLIEYFPYHSARFAHSKVRVPSQAYAFALVRGAIARGAIIFITRGRELWLRAVPELGRYARVYRTRSVQNIVILPKNCPEGYPLVEAVLRDARP